MDEFGFMADGNAIIRVDSRSVADKFEKVHKNVLRDIKRIVSDESGYSKEFTERNFVPSVYKDSNGRNQPRYLMSRDGFCALAMGFTGTKADKFREDIIRHFNEMEAQLKQLQALKDQNPMLTEAIRLNREDPKPYHYSNEFDMLNRIVLGMSAKEFREKHGISKSGSIRPYFTKEEAELMEALMEIDVGLQYSTPDFQQRKHILDWYALSHRKENRSSDAA